MLRLLLVPDEGMNSLARDRAQTISQIFSLADDNGNVNLDEHLANGEGKTGAGSPSPPSQRKISIALTPSGQQIRRLTSVFHLAPRETIIKSYWPSRPKNGDAR